MKKCSRCKCFRDESKFYKNKSRKDGLKHYCKECAKECSREYYKNNPEKELERERERRKNNPEYSREYYKNHREEKREYHREWYKNNREKVLEYDRERYKNNLEKILERGRKYRKKNPEYSREWRKNNPEKFSEYSSIRRKMGYISLWDNPFPSEIKIHHHHLNRKPGLIIPLPQITHQIVKGKNHYTHNLKWIKKLYCLNIERLFEIKKPKRIIDDWL